MYNIILCKDSMCVLCCVNILCLCWFTSSYSFVCSQCDTLPTTCAMKGIDVYLVVNAWLKLNLHLQQTSQ